ncbi:MAG: hypothetical protein AAF802_19785 [Planctomycetota bacterium]
MPSTPSTPHVAERLRQAIEKAKSLGFDVRKVLLNDESANWCQVGSRKLIFLDLSAAAGEQLHQLTDILEAYQRVHQLSVNDRRASA